MGERNAVISGASIAGLSAAFWLRRTGWDVTVVERAPSFRDGGQNVDVRGIGREVLVRMGLFEAVKAQNTTETGTVIVDAFGKVKAELPSDGSDGATAELEVLRGDFARTILDHLPDGVEFVYGDTIDTVTDGPDHVAVTTSAGRTLRADLLVVAEGVRSTTRDRIFGDDVDRRELGVTMVFGTIPRTSDDDDRWRWHNAVRGRQIHLRPDNHGTTRAILAYAPGDDLIGFARADALARVRDRYAGTGWETPRILDAFDASDDVYIDQLAQIRMSTWHRGRVVMAGDAGWCVTPMGGGGASLALTSGYVLAAYLAEGPDDLEPALAAYEQWMRPLVDDVQSLPRGLKHFAYPQTRVGLALRGIADRVLTSPPMKPVAARLTRVASTDKALPDIPRPYRTNRPPGKRRPDPAPAFRLPPQHFLRIRAPTRTPPVATARTRPTRTFGRSTMTIDPAQRNVFVPHAYPEHRVDLGEISMNYATAGDPENPAVLLIPEQSGSWWGYEETMKLLEDDFDVYAVDLRGQGRSTWTPRRYSLDNFGNDLVRFIATVIKRPVIVAGNSSGGVLAAWLSAYAMPGQVRGALLEDPPLFASELVTTCGHSIRQAVGPGFKLIRDYLGDQWSVGDWAGFCRANIRDFPNMEAYFNTDEIPQNMREYDPEWARAFYEGTVALHCPHELMLGAVKTPIMLTQHARMIDPTTGNLIGALSDEQATRARQLMEAAGAVVSYESAPDAMHMMHQFDPERYTTIFRSWASALPA